MLTRAQKSIVFRPIYGYAPGLVATLAVGCVALGVLSAIALDHLTGGTGLAGGTDESLSTEFFESPTDAIVRSEAGDPSLPWIRNAAPFPANDPAPRLAIVVIDDGSDASAALSAMRLSAPITLAIAPTADAADKRAAAARRFGREVLLLLPMQAEDRLDRQPNPIAMHVPRDELMRRMIWNLAQIDGYVGVMNHHGEATTRDAETMRAVMEVMKTEGLGFVDARAHDDSLAGAVARRMGVPTADRIVAIEAGADAAELGAGLAVGLKHAERWGAAIVTVPAERRLVSALQDWIEGQSSDVKLAPVTAIIKRMRSGKV